MLLEEHFLILFFFIKNKKSNEGNLNTINLMKVLIAGKLSQSSGKIIKLDSLEV